MLRFIDGISHYATADIVRKYSNMSGGTVLTTSGRFGGGALNIPSSGFVIKTLDAQATWIVGFAFNAAGLPTTGSQVILEFLDQGSVQLDLRVFPDGTLALTRAGTLLTGSLSTVAISVSTWHYIEVKILISAAAGATTNLVKVDGATVITLAAGQQTNNTSNLTANSIAFLGSLPSALFCDIYICDGTTGVNNTFLGDVRVFTTVPSASGNQTDWSVFGTANNWSAVNEVPPDNDTTYVYSSTPGQIDLYNLADLTLTGSIIAVQVVLDARKDDAGTRSIAAAVRTGGVNYFGSTTNLSTSYLFYVNVWATNPNTSVAWIGSDINALQCGQKMIA